jgi:hypothetical protein
MVLAVVLGTLVSPGYSLGQDLFRRFMDLMGSSCGSFGCKRGGEDSDFQVSRAVRSYAQSFKAAGDDDSQQQPGLALRDLHETLRSAFSADPALEDSALVQKVREQSRRLAEFARRDMDENDPIQKAVRSLLDLNNDIANLKKRDDEDEEESLRETAKDLSSEENPIQKAVRSILELSENPDERDTSNDVKRTLMDLHKDIGDLRKRDDESQKEVRAPLMFARRAFNENARMVRAIRDLYDALEE